MAKKLHVTLGLKKARITKNNFPKDMTKKLLQNSCFLKHGKIATPKKNNWFKLVGIKHPESARTASQNVE